MIATCASPAKQLRKCRKRRKWRLWIRLIPKASGRQSIHLTVTHLLRQVAAETQRSMIHVTLDPEVDLCCVKGCQVYLFFSNVGFSTAMNMVWLIDWWIVLPDLENYSTFQVQLNTKLLNVDDTKALHLFTIGPTLFNSSWQLETYKYTLLNGTNKMKTDED